MNGLVTTGFLNPKFAEVDNKTRDVSGLVKKIDYDAKISDIQKKYFTTADYNKLTSETLDAKIKQKELMNKTDISSFGKNPDLTTKLATLATKSRLKSRTR